MICWNINNNNLEYCCQWAFPGLGWWAEGLLGFIEEGLGRVAVFCPQ